MSIPVYITDFNLPAGWKVTGCLPDRGKADPNTLSEDLVQAVSPDGRLVLDIGYGPEADVENGRYICRAILDQNWEDPLHDAEFHIHMTALA